MKSPSEDLLDLQILETFFASERAVVFAVSGRVEFRLDDELFALAKYPPKKKKLESQTNE